VAFSPAAEDLTTSDFLLRDVGSLVDTDVLPGIGTELFARCGCLLRGLLVRLSATYPLEGHLSEKW